MSAVQIQFTMQKAFIEKMVRKPESNSVTDPDTIFREVLRNHDVFIV
jgi:hypothetical protein